jgi:hypothetical protein
MNLDLSVLHAQSETSQCMKLTFSELDDVCRERHDEVLGVAQMTEKEREVRAGNFPNIKRSVFDIAAAPRENTWPDR